MKYYSIKINFEFLLLILTCVLVLTFLKGRLTCHHSQMAWQDDSVPDGIFEDDPPLNDVTRSRQGRTQVILDK